MPADERDNPPTLPHSIEAEMALLGAILTNNRAYDRVAAILRPEHFYDAIHADIYRVAQEMIEQGRTADPVVLWGQFQADPRLEPLGGARYLARLASSVVTLVNSGDYGRIIVDCYRRRKVIEVADQARDMALDRNLEMAAHEIAEMAAHEMDEISRDHSVGTRSSLGQAVTDALLAAEEATKRGDKLAGFTCGYGDIDNTIGGLEGGQQYVLAGRPSMGKSALAVSIMDRCGAAGVPVFFVSGEMTGKQIGRRVVAPRIGMSPFALKAGIEDPHDMVRLMDAQRRLAQFPVVIEELVRLAEIRARARQWARPLRRRGLIIVDHLNLIQGSKSKSDQSDTAEVTEISKAFKQLAKETDSALLLLTQLNRGPEGREDKRPGLADLRQSGGIEQDADVVMFIYREAYYLERSEPKERPGEKSGDFVERVRAWREAVDKNRNVAEVIVAKNRDGPAPRTIRLYFDAVLGRFDPLEIGRGGEDGPNP